MPVLPISPTYLLYYLPLIVSISLVFGATRHEALPLIWRHALHTARWITSFMAIIFLVLAGLGLVPLKILTLGGGTVGRWIADMLARERHSVTLIDSDPEVVRSINEDLDVRAIEGNASQSTVLFAADVLSADLCLAVTGDDEVNIVAASMAKALGARRSIARVYAPAFRDLSTFDYQRHFNIDALLSLEQLTAAELARKIRNPDAIPLEHFARGQLEVYEMNVAAGSDADGTKLMDLSLPAGVRIGSISRDGKTWIASGADEVRAADRVSLVGNARRRDRGPNHRGRLAAANQTLQSHDRRRRGDRLPPRLAARSR